MGGKCFSDVPSPGQAERQTTFKKAIAILFVILLIILKAGSSVIGLPEKGGQRFSNILKATMFLKRSIQSLLKVFFLVTFSLAPKGHIKADQCRQLTKSPLLGIKQSRQYLRQKELKYFKSAAAARSQGYSHFQKCDKTKSYAGKGVVCGKIVGIKNELLFLRASELITLTSVKRGKSLGFTAYKSCLKPLPITPVALTPTPVAPHSTPTPSVTPLPALKFTLEAGVRLPGVCSNTVLPLENGGYRAYFAYSAGSFGAKALKTAQSADGLNWSEPTALGLVKPQLASHIDPSVVRRGSTYVLVFRESRRITSAGLDINSFFRATSSDGLSFTLDPATALLDGREEISWYRPKIVSIGEHSLRMYYEAMGRRSAISSDDGLTWTEEGEVAILGNSVNFAPYPVGINVIRLSDGRFKMFCNSAVSQDQYVNAIYSAISSDGRTFQMEEGPLLQPPAGKDYLNPHAVLLADGRYRLYFTEAGDQLEYNLLSAISD